MKTLSLRTLALIGAAACACALAVALGSERYLNMIPCALCLLERWPYRIGIAVGLAGCVIPLFLARPALWLLVATLAVAAAVAALHVGVEQHWWPSPLPECTAPRFFGMSAADRLAAMPLRPSKSCEDADYPLHGLPITYAQANLVYALAVGGFLAMFLFRPSRRPR